MYRGPKSKAVKEKELIEYLLPLHNNFFKHGNFLVLRKDAKETGINFYTSFYGAGEILESELDNSNAQGNMKTNRTWGFYRELVSLAKWFSSSCIELKYLSKNPYKLFNEEFQNRIMYWLNYSENILRKIYKESKTEFCENIFKKCYGKGLKQIEQEKGKDESLEEKLRVSDIKIDTLGEEGDFEERERIHVKSDMEVKYRRNERLIEELILKYEKATEVLYKSVNELEEARAPKKLEKIVEGATKLNQLSNFFRNIKTSYDHHPTALSGRYKNILSDARNYCAIQQHLLTCGSNFAHIIERHLREESQNYFRRKLVKIVSIEKLEEVIYQFSIPYAMKFANEGLERVTPLKQKIKQITDKEMWIRIPNLGLYLSENIDRLAEIGEKFGKVRIVIGDKEIELKTYENVKGDFFIKEEEYKKMGPRKEIRGALLKAKDNENFLIRGPQKAHKEIIKLSFVGGHKTKKEIKRAQHS